MNLVKGLLPQLAEKGRVEWGWLGVGIAEVSDDDVAAYGLTEPRGVLIRNVVAGQPADRGGMKAETWCCASTAPTSRGRAIFSASSRARRWAAP